LRLDRLAVQGGWCVKVNRIFRRRLVAVPFLADDMQQDGTLQFADHLQVLAEHRDVVPIDRSEVPKAQVLEQHAPVQTGFDALLQLRQKPLGRIAQQGHSIQNPSDFVLQP
jgi:hypothetical protein